MPPSAVRPRQPFPHDRRGPFPLPLALPFNKGCVGQTTCKRITFLGRSFDRFGDAAAFGIEIDDAVERIDDRIATNHDLRDIVGFDGCKSKAVYAALARQRCGLPFDDCDRRWLRVGDIRGQTRAGRNVQL